MYPETTARYIESNETTGLVKMSSTGLRSALATILERGTGLASASLEVYRLSFVILRMSCAMRPSMTLALVSRRKSIEATVRIPPCNPSSNSSQPASIHAHKLQTDLEKGDRGPTAAEVK